MIWRRTHQRSAACLPFFSICLQSFRAVEHNAWCDFDSIKFCFEKRDIKSKDYFVIILVNISSYNIYTYLGHGSCNHTVYMWRSRPFLEEEELSRMLDKTPGQLQRSYSSLTSPSLVIVILLYMKYCKKFEIQSHKSQKQVSRVYIKHHV